MQLFDRWFEAARASAGVVEVNAMALATSSADGAPSVRMVLLKHVDPDRAAFTWFTNLESRKAREAFTHEPGHAALAWWWPGDESTPGRQVRATGTVELLDRAAVAAYFDSRPVDAQIGAAASRQSTPIASRAALDEQAAMITRAAERGGVDLPDTWGGITLVADELEFWQGRHGRLHDRIVFQRGTSTHEVPEVATRVVDSAGNEWQRFRLQP